MASIGFLLSGASGLVLQVAWSAQLAQALGASEVATAVVLAAFMAGLTVGAALAARRVDRLRRPLLCYAAVELVVAAVALAFRPVARVVELLQEQVVGGQPVLPAALSWSSGAFGVLAALGLLLLPTAAMGASMPLLVRGLVRADAELGPRVSLLYGINTLGAAAGALLAAFVLLPALGLDATVVAAAGGNLAAALAVGLLAVLGEARAADLATASVDRALLSGEQQPAPQGGQRWARSWVAWVAAIGAVASFAAEVTWARLLGPLLGGSVYALGALLAAVLLGLAGGGMLAAPLADDPARARRALVWAQLLAAAALLAAFPLTLELAETWVGPRGPVPGDELVGPFALAPALVLAATLVPGWIAIGATFPLAVRCLAGGARDAARASGRVFAASTGGALVGALLAGLVLLPMIGMTACLRLIAVLLASAALLAALARRPRHGAEIVGALAIVATAVLVPLGDPQRLARRTPFVIERGELVHYRVGRGATVALFDQGDAWRLTTNGLAESLVHKRGSRPCVLATARWMALLPLLGERTPEQLLVVGLGGGVVLEEASVRYRRLDVVELEPEVVAANRSMAAGRRVDPLADPRLSLVVNDARSALRLTARRFDAIVSQPSHPWTSGAASLYTRELFALVRGRLAAGGTLVQWMGLAYVDEDLLRRMGAALLAAFPEVELFAADAQSVLWVASDRPLLPLADGLARDPAAWRRAGVGSAVEIEAARLLATAGVRAWVAGAAPLADGDNPLATRATRIGGAALRTHETLALRLAALDPLREPLEAMPPAAALARIEALLRSGQRARARRLAASVKAPVDRVARALVDLATGPRATAEARGRLLALLDDVPDALGAVPGLAPALTLLFRQELAASAPLRFAGALPPLPAAVAAGWRAEREGRFDRLRDLDPVLADSPALDPLADEATRLRVEARLAGWREGAPPAAADGCAALALVDAWLRPLASPAGLLQRARAAALCGRLDEQVASLAEIVRSIERSRGDRRLLDEVRGLATASPSGADPRLAALVDRVAALAAER